MKISDLTSLLAKVQSIAGDVDVVLKAAIDDAETVISDLGIHLDPATGNAGGTLTVTHAPAPVAVAPPPAQDDPAA